jgi:hypothetical protein
MIALIFLVFSISAVSFKQPANEVESYHAFVKKQFAETEQRRRLLLNN